MPFPIAALFSIGGQALNFLHKNKLANEQQRLANAIHPVNTTYQTSPYAQHILGLGLNAYNSEMPGTSQFKNNIFAAQGNTNAAIDRNATDSGTALSLITGNAGNTNDALSNLQTKEAGYRNAMLGNLNNAYGIMINEGDKVYKDKVRRYETDLNAKMALQGAAIQNKGSAVNDIAGGIQSVGMGLENWLYPKDNEGGNGGGGATGLFGRAGNPAVSTGANNNKFRKSIDQLQQVDGRWYDENGIEYDRRGYPIEPM